MLVDPGRAVCIAVVRLTGHEDRGAVPATGRHLRVLASTHHLISVMSTGEEGFDILMQATSTIVADIDDDPLLLIVLAEDIRVDGTEAWVAHRGDMHVAQFSTRDTLYLGCTLLDPALIE